MTLARVVGTVVATRKDPRLEGKKLLVVKMMSPDGREDGGYLVAEGTPEEIAQVEASHTGRFLKAALGMAQAT